MRKVPKLRFKEFTDEWEEKKLGDICERITEKNTENNTNVLTISAQYGLISQIDFFNKSVAGKDLTKYYLLKKDDFAYNKSYSNGYPFGAIKKLNKYEKGIVSTLYICFRLKDRSKTNVDFFEQFFESKKIDKNIQDIAQEGARNHGLLNINISDFFDITKYIPSFQEQEKIANFLSSIDKKISLTVEKLKLFKEYKKGVMQKIFSQELRFKDNEGNDYPEWEEKRLGDVLESIIDNRGKTPPNNDNNKLIPLIEVNAIGERNIKYGNVTKFVDEETYINWFRNYIQKDDILFSTVGATALCSIYKANIKSVIAQNLVGLRAKKEIISDYLYYILIDKKNNLKFKSIEMIAVQPSIKVSQMVDLKFKISISLEEQQKIADFLSSIDTKIENIEKELENLKEFKKGLLQQMFV